MSSVQRLLCWAVNQDSLINCEKWADSDRLNWYENEIPKTVAAGAVVIGSVGHTLKEAQAIVKDVERAGAHMIELVSYTEDTLLPMLDYTKEGRSNKSGRYDASGPIHFPTGSVQRM